MLSLPTNPELKELFDLETLVDYRSLPTFRPALHSARRSVTRHGVRSVCFIAYRANGELWLVRVGKRGAWRKLWSFGNPFSN